MLSLGIAADDAEIQGGIIADGIVSQPQPDENDPVIEEYIDDDHETSEPKKVVLDIVQT